MSVNDSKPAVPSEPHESGWYPPVARRFLWADSPSAVRGLIKDLTVLCLILFLLDFVVHRHAKVPGEGLWGFYAIVGFVSFALIVLAAGKLRTFIGRPEDYYAPNAVDAERYPPEGLEVREYEGGS